MSIERLLQAQKQENRDIIQSLLDDGSEADAEYTIEHHFRPLTLTAWKRPQSMPLNWALRLTMPKRWNWMMVV